MIAIMLCAGFGTRLHPLTKNIPKGLLEVAGKRILDYQMPLLLDLPDLKGIHLITNGRYVSQFYTWKEEWSAQLQEKDIKLWLHNDGSLKEDDRLGSVGDLAFLLRRLDLTEPVVITAGDNIYRFPLRPIAESFLSSGDNVVLALREPNHQVRQRYAVVEFGEGDQVAHLHDEPENPPTEWVVPSLYFLQPDAIKLIHAYLEEGGAEDSFASYIDYIMERASVRAVRKPDARMWLDVETKYMFKKANDILEAEEVMVQEEEAPSPAGA